MDIGVDEVRPAVVAIDCHRGHLDPAVATMPLDADLAARVIAANEAFFARCRAAGVPIVHLVTSYRDAREIRTNPFWRTRADDPAASRKNVERHNIEGSPGCTPIASLYDSGRDWVVDSKKRYDCFIATDLDFVLRKHKVNTLFVTGVNTNSCVLATVAAANVRDYAAIVVEDCVQTMDGDDLHAAALLCIRTALGWVMTGDEIAAAFLDG
jgi:nicotinamidase-related amidase